MCMVSLQVMDVVLRGGRPEESLAEGAPDAHVGLMRACWIETPEKRPTFKQVSNKTVESVCSKRLCTCTVTMAFTGQSINLHIMAGIFSMGHSINYVRPTPRFAYNTQWKCMGDLSPPPLLL